MPQTSTADGPLPGAAPGGGSTPNSYNPINPTVQPTSNDQFTTPADAMTSPAETWTAPAAATGLDGSRAGQSAYGIPGMGGGAGTYSGTSGLGSTPGSGISSGAGSGGGGVGGGGILTGGYGSGGYGSGGMGSVDQESEAAPQDRRPAPLRVEHRERRPPAPPREEVLPPAA
ncbi:hypothetical protein GS444_24025 [Rhodococcus hoagii]|nr:hypothetical protein [Prescottella equi]